MSDNIKNQVLHVERPLRASAIYPELIGVYNQVVIRNIPSIIDENHLQILLEHFGPVRGVRMRHDGRDRFLRFASVLFYEGCHAYAAMDLKGLFLLGKSISMQLRRQPFDFAWHTNLIVYGIPASYSITDVMNYFGEFGLVISCKICFENINFPLPNGIGFVRYRTRTEANKAIEATKNAGTRTNPFSAKIAYPKSRPSHNNHVWHPTSLDIHVNNLPKKFLDKDLLNRFLQCGPISYARIIRNKEGECLGRAIVRMLRKEDGLRALALIKPWIFHGHNLRINVAPDTKHLPNDQVDSLL